MKDYIEDIKYSYPACGIVKDPFANAVGRKIGLGHVSRFWKFNNNRAYRLTFNSIDHPMPMPYVLFSHSADNTPNQVIFKVGKSIVQILEKLALDGHTIFVSNSIWTVKNIIWRPHWTYEQVMIDMDLHA